MHYDFNSSIDLIWIIIPLIFLIVLVRFLPISFKGILFLESTLLIALITIPLYFSARAIFGGILFSLILLYKTRLSSYLNRKFVFSLVLIGILLVLFKYNSFLSRIHIWKISISLWKKNWLYGLDRVPFNVTYNHEQANWFAKQATLNTKVGLLANDGYYAFNDWLQFSIEYGIIGLVSSVLIIIL